MLSLSRTGAWCDTTSNSLSHDLHMIDIEACLDWSRNQRWVATRRLGALHWVATRCLALRRMIGAVAEFFSATRRLEALVNRK